MTLEEIRRLILIAVFSDDKLFELLVLKGGNALELVLGVGDRASVDLDFSMAAEFDDLDEARERLFRALRRQFLSKGFVVFDEKLIERPRIRKDSQPQWWGGYEATFKIVRRDIWDECGDDLERVRRRAEAADAAHRRKFKIDISKREYCEGKLKREVDDYTVYVYSPEMLAIEKLRAICQQMPEYEIVPERMKRARARDFYDVCEIVRALDLNLATQENLELMECIFAAKGVPMELLSKIVDHKEFHRQDWPAVEASVRVQIKSFDEYFDELIGLVQELEALRKI